MERMVEQQDLPIRVTDVDALKDNVQRAVDGFAERWICIPAFTPHCEVMDIRQLRDAMGLRATVEYGDPWPLAEKHLKEYGFAWSWLGTSRVMFLQERSEYLELDTTTAGGDLWEEAEEV